MSFLSKIFQKKKLDYFLTGPVQPFIVGKKVEALFY